LDLGDSFVLNFFSADAAPEQAAKEYAEPWAEETGCWLEERPDLSGRQNRLAVREDDVAADP